MFNFKETVNTLLVNQSKYVFSDEWEPLNELTHSFHIHRSSCLFIYAIKQIWRQLNIDIFAFAYSSALDIELPLSKINT